MTFKIITDSTADLPQNFVEAHDIAVLGMTVNIDDQSFKTVGPDAISNEELLAAINAGKTVSTAQVNAGQFAEVFKSLADQEMLYLGFSSGLSGTFQSAVMAVDLVKEELPEAKITVVDTLAAASGQGFLVEEVIKWRDAGDTVAQVLEKLDDLKMRLHSLFMVDDLNHLARGGRIPKAVAMVGTMANIKPLLDVDQEGKLRQKTKVRGKKKALKAMVETVLSNLDSHYPRLLLAYSGTPATAEEIKAKFLEEQPALNIDIRPLSPTIVTHTGEGTLAIFSMATEARQ